jgi:CBS domain containing-hemolysin-like protein
MYFTGCTDAPGLELSKRRLAYVDRELSILEASRLMRASGAAELLVTDPAEGALLLPVGIVSARDIVTRVVAAELDPSVLTAGDISWSDGPAAPAHQTDTLQLKESGDGTLFTVLDSAGAVAGMLTLEEIVKALARKSSAPSS